MIKFSRRHPEAVAAVALILVPLALLGHALLPGRVLSPADLLLSSYPWKALAPGLVSANPMMTDVTQLFHPWAIYAGREIRQGRFPLWKPHVFTGAPFFANPQTAVLFPLTALAYVLPVATAVTLISLLKLSAAGVAMYWFLRVLSVAPPSAAVAALAFMLNGDLLVWLQWPLSTTMIFLPLLLGIIDRLREGNRVRWAGVLAVAVALLIFAGYPQGAFVGVLLATAWTGSRLPGTVAPSRFLLGYVAGTVLGVLLAAVQLLPFLEYARASSVFAYRNEWIPLFHLWPESAISLLLPYYYGSPMGWDFWGGFNPNWGDFNFNKVTGSVGLVPWLVLPVAALAGWRRRGTKFFLGLAAVSAVMLYGGGADLLELPVLSWLIGVHVIPPLFVFALAVLCGIGLDAAATGGAPSSRPPQRVVRWAVLPLVTIPLLFVLHDYPMLARQSRTVAVILQYLAFLVLVTAGAVLLLRWCRGGDRAWRWGLALGGVELLSVAPLALTYNPVIDVQWFYPATPAIEYLQREVARDHGRVVLGFNVAMLYGLSDVAGFDGMTPRRLEQLIGPVGFPGDLAIAGSGAFTGVTIFHSPSVDLLGIRYLVLPPTARDAPPHFSLSYDGFDARIYRSEHALPRAFVVPRARCVDDDAAVRHLWARDIDVREEVLLADCDRAPGAAPRGGVSRAEIRDDEPQRAVIEATTDARAYLVLTDTWFPGWRVWIDGVERHLWRANHAFRAVWLPSGQHEVEFRYSPSAVRIGFAVSMLAASAIALLFVAGAGGVRALRRRWRAATGPRTSSLLIGLLLGFSAGAAEARLPAPPFALSVSPSVLPAGATATIRIDPRRELGMRPRPRDTICTWRGCCRCHARST